MELVDIFALPRAFDPDQPSLRAHRLAKGFGHSDGLDLALRTRVAQDETLAMQAAALVDFALDGFHAIDGDGIAAVHDLAVLALAIDGLHEREELVVPDESRGGALGVDLEALAGAVRGEGARVNGPLTAYVLRIRQRLGRAQGWQAAIGFEDKLGDLLNGFVQDQRMRAMSAAPLGASLAAHTKAGWIDIVIDAACIVAGDTSRTRVPAVADRVGRLAGMTVGLARELSEFLRTHDVERSLQLIAQRLAVPVKVIQLGQAELARALRATFELEIRDLLEATTYLETDPPQPRAAIVRQTLAAVIQLDGSAAVLKSVWETRPQNREAVMNAMRCVARDDGEITSEERALLRSMDTNAQNFETLKRRIEEDRAVDFEEFEQQRSSRLRILDDMFKVALADNVIDPDERLLLLRAMELLPTMRAG